MAQKRSIYTPEQEKQLLGKGYTWQGLAISKDANGNYGFMMPGADASQPMAPFSPITKEMADALGLPHTGRFDAYAQAQPDTSEGGSGINGLVSSGYSEGSSPQYYRPQYSPTEYAVSFLQAPGASGSFMKRALQGMAVPISMMMPVLAAGPLGALGNAISGAIAETPLAGAINAFKGLPMPVQGALKSAAMSGITGGNPLKAAVTGGLAGLGGMAAEGLGLNPQLGSFLTKQGYGAYRQSQARDKYAEMKQAREMMRRAQLARRSPFPQRTV